MVDGCVIEERSLAIKRSSFISGEKGKIDKTHDSREKLTHPSMLVYHILFILFSLSRFL